MPRLERLLEQLPSLQSETRFKLEHSDISKEALSNTGLYSLGFARRFMFPDFYKPWGLARVDIAHSAVFIQPINSFEQANGKPIIVGRLPPFFSKKHSGFKNPISTRMCYEQSFPFLSWRPFDVTKPAYYSRIIVSGYELKAALKAANKICVDQIGDFVHSNCYSADMVTFAELACIIAARQIFNQHQYAMTVYAIRGCLSLIHEYATNHYSIGVGNNSFVLDQVQKAIKIVRIRGYGNVLNTVRMRCYGNVPNYSYNSPRLRP